MVIPFQQKVEIMTSNKEQDGTKKRKAESKEPEDLVQCDKLKGILDECITHQSCMESKFYKLGGFVQTTPILIAGQKGVEDRIARYLTSKEVPVFLRKADVDATTLIRAYKMAKLSGPCVLLLTDAEELKPYSCQTLLETLGKAGSEKARVTFICTSGVVESLPYFLLDWPGVMLVEGCNRTK